MVVKEFLIFSDEIIKNYAAWRLKCLLMISPTWSFKFISPCFLFSPHCKFTIDFNSRNRPLSDTLIVSSILTTVYIMLA